MSLAEGFLSAQLIKNTFTFLSGCERYLPLCDADPVRSNHDSHWLLAFVRKVTPGSCSLKVGSQINCPSRKASVVYFAFAFEVIEEDTAVGDYRGKGSTEIWCWSTKNIITIIVR